jgi:hypothetical protein
MAKDFRAMVIADLHGNTDATKYIFRSIELYEPDVLIVCGDITDFGKPKNLIKQFFDSIYIPVFAVPGNCDPLSTIEELEASKAFQMHNKKQCFNGRIFVGMGGANPPSLGTPFILSEKEIFAKLDRIMENGSILISHAPPKGHLDRIFFGIHAGSRAIASIVNKYKPVLVCCAHIHEARGVERSDCSTFVNPGPAFKGFFALVNFESATINVELLRCY